MKGANVELFEISNPVPRTFELRGELDISTVPLLLDAVTSTRHEPGDLLFDLRDLSFMDSTAVNAMVQIARPLSDGSLVLAGAKRIVKRILEITSLDGHDNIRVLSDWSEPTK